MKEELRKKYLIIRKQIDNKEEKSKIIMKKIISLTEYKKSNIIALYNSLPNEVSTKELIEYTLQNKKNVVLPRVYKNTLKFYKISSNEDYETSSFNVLEPQDILNNYVQKEKIDLIIVPGICFDNDGNRIGYGKGYYDHYLTDDMNSIGICFSEQLVPKINVDKHDKKVKKIITN